MLQLTSTPSAAARRMNRASALPVFLVLLAACATPPKAPEADVPTPEPELKSPPSKAVRQAPTPKRPGPIPARALNVNTDCAFRDETGYNGSLKLAIEQARVRSFEATVNIPRRGTCRFDLKNFRQTREMPNVELSHLRDRCIVRVWEQGERITVAFQQCQKMCSGSAWEHLWPILTDTRDGSCA
ncbi:MAG: hypothetical protein K8R10_15820 [Rhodocyclales bacterium]|nr:hypothetical protein [Rhodocyclales bacterium]